MKNSSLKIVLLVVGTFMFHVLFWKEQLGINLILFCFYVLICNYLTKESIINKKVVVTLTGVTISLGGVLFINSDLSKFSAIMCLLVFVSFSHYNELRFVWSSLLTSVNSMFKIPQIEVGYKKSIIDRIFKNWNTRAKLILLPVLVLIIFIILFRYANPIFDSYVSNIQGYVDQLINDVFKELSFKSVLFFIAGFFITSGLIIKRKNAYFVNRDKSKVVTIVRKRKAKPLSKNPFQEGNISKSTYPSRSILGLKNERTSAIIMLVFMGGLLFVINVIDINYVWLGNPYSEAKSLTEIVHEGTYLLITSVLLSILIMLYIFRRNQNFYGKNDLLKKLSYLWIIQNGILVLSVVIRNHNYISNYGLTYKRIGVYLFLLSTIVGLAFLYLKIKNKRSVYYLFLNNGWFIYFTIVLSSIVNWDGLIVNYNLRFVKKNNIDYTYLVQLSDNALIAIYDNQKRLNLKKWNEKRYLGTRTYKTPRELFLTRIEKISRKPVSVLSWNYSGYARRKYFKMMSYGIKK